jgi:hypothetical protein
VPLVVAGLVALVTHQPWLFPSLGPAVMLHVEKPEAPESSPRNTLIGHGVAIVAGFGFLVLCGLRDNRSVLQGGMSPARIVAAAGSLAVTAVVPLMVDASHPPAGATTLIVSLGLLRDPTQLAVDRLYNRDEDRHADADRGQRPRPVGRPGRGGLHDRDLHHDHRRAAAAAQEPALQLRLRRHRRIASVDRRRTGSGTVSTDSFRRYVRACGPGRVCHYL